MHAFDEEMRAVKGSVKQIVLGSVLALGFGLASTAAMSQAKVDNGVLTDRSGKTLYTFDKDAAGSGKSACTGGCEKLWVPFTAASAPTASTGSSGSKEYTVIQRDDGTKQWAYKGKPLYTFAKDQKPGDKSGDNFNKVWHIAKP